MKIFEIVYFIAEVFFYHNTVTIGILVEPLKAFDTVNHDISLQKLKSMELRIIGFEAIHLIEIKSYVLLILIF